MKTTSLIPKDLLEQARSEAVASALHNGMKAAAELDELIRRNTFDISRIPRADTEVCWINGQLAANKGNVVTFTGAAKSRKTVMATSLIASAISGREILGIDCRLQEGEKILHIDTEQGYKAYYENVMRILKSSGHTAPPPNFISIHERAFDVGQRFASIERLFELHKPSIVVIDGIRDMLMDFNSNEETAKVIDMVMRLSFEYDALIVCVIHVTKSHGNMRGALGTALEDKSETVIKVEKDAEDKDRSKIYPIYSRNRDFEPFEIVWDNVENAYRKEDVQANASPGRPRKAAAESMTEEQNRAMLNAAFVGGRELGYGEMVEALKLAYKVGTNRAKEIAKEMQAAGLIIHDGKSYRLYTPPF